MQPLPRQAEPGRENRIGTVEPVAHARVPHRRHVHPDLMGSAGFQLHLDEAGRAEGLERVVMGDGWPSFDDNREPAVA